MKYMSHRLATSTNVYVNSHLVCKVYVM